MALELKAKIWLEKEQKKVFGDGPADILERVNRTGSLRRAAAEIGMSYSQAWRLVGMLEQNFGFKMLERKTGGEGGGFSRLTPEAARLTAAYRFFRREADKSLHELFAAHILPATRGHKKQVRGG